MTGSVAPVLEARDLAFAYNRRKPVLQGVSLDVAPGEITMILGRSGSGKTTLLKVLKGLLRPQQGSVRLNVGERGRGHAGEIAYVPQTLGLVGSLSALDNALTGAVTRAGRLPSLLKVFPRDIVAEAKDTMTRLGIGSRIHDPVYQLSGGQRQRVAIARALMQRPALVLADEFVSQLDSLTATEILDLMRDIAHNRGVALLVTTHETDMVEAYADRVVIMREGRIAHDVRGGMFSQAEMVDLLR